MKKNKNRYKNIIYRIFDLVEIAETPEKRRKLADTLYLKVYKHGEFLAEMSARTREYKDALNAVNQDLVFRHKAIIKDTIQGKQSTAVIPKNTERLREKLNQKFRVCCEADDMLGECTKIMADFMANEVKLYQASKNSSLIQPSSCRPR